MIASLTAAWLRLPPNLRGILWLALGTLSFAANDVLVKTLGRTMSPFQLAFFRYAIGIVVLAPIFLRAGPDNLRTGRPGIHFLRTILACSAQVGVYASVVHLPLADATALSFSRILFTTLIAVVLLKEVVSGRRWTATMVGFAGVVVIVRPGGTVDPMALVAIAAASTFAIGNVMIRMMSDTEPPTRILFYSQVGGMLIFLLPAIWVWHTPATVAAWLMSIAIGVLTTFGMVGFVRGFAVGEASVIGPTEYIRLIFAAFFGFTLFGEVPDIWTIAGALLIVGCTSFIARSEARPRKGV